MPSSRGIFPHPGIEPASLRSPALAGGFFTTRATWEAHHQIGSVLKLASVLNHNSVNGEGDRSWGADCILIGNVLVGGFQTGASLSIPKWLVKSLHFKQVPR